MPDVEYYFRIVSALGLDDLMAEMDEVSGEVYALSSPSVRLARWLDADPERFVRIERYADAWGVTLIARGDVVISSEYASTRDEAITAALAKGEAGATTEGER